MRIKNSPTRNLQPIDPIRAKALELTMGEDGTATISSDVAGAKVEAELNEEGDKLSVFEVLPNGEYGEVLEISVTAPSVEEEVVIKR